MALLKEIRMGRKRADPEAPGAGACSGAHPRARREASTSSLRGLLAGLKGLVPTTTHEDQWLFCLKWQFSAEKGNTPQVTPDAVVIWSRSRVPRLRPRGLQPTALPCYRILQVRVLEWAAAPSPVPTQVVKFWLKATRLSFSWPQLHALLGL